MTEIPSSAFSTRAAFKASSLCLTLASATLFFAQYAAASNQQAAANFSQADANSDGALTPSEFKVFMDLNAAHGIGRAQQVRDRNLYGRAFGRLDANRDGLLTTPELQNARR